MPNNDNKLSLRVRMYRQGLGDCFLLTFMRDGQDDFNVLIDCGIFKGTTNATSIMKQVAEDIKKTTNEKLDVVALTHDHYDHTSGFSMAQEIFNKIKFKQVWVGWTEDKSRDDYDPVREQFRIQAKGLRSALKLDAMQSKKLNGLRETVEELVNHFFGLGPDEFGVVEDDSDKWKYVLGKDNAEIKYWEPGKKAVTVNELGDDVRFYILGPPLDFKQWFRAKEPRNKAEREAESYRHSLAMSLAETFLAASDENDNFLNSVFYQPFDKNYEVCLEDAKDGAENNFFVEHYGFTDKDKEWKQKEWRRIEEDWLMIAEPLALRLDSYTNNTCLAFAIELVKSGKVLIFPGDAQFGNWYSWKDLSWEVTGKNGEKIKVTTEDLLNRAVFYKVGHHGSHNATLKKHGLEMMGYPDFSADLVAMIPTNQDFAKKKVSEDNPDGWEMPDEILEKDLTKRARGRVILADEAGKTGQEKKLLKERCQKIAAGKLSAAELEKFLDKVEFGKAESDGSFVRNPKESLTPEPLYVDYTIEG